MKTLFALAALPLSFACSQAANVPPPDPGPPAVAAAAPLPAADHVDVKATFDSRCGSCHGASGKGDGPAAAGLNPKPRDYSDRAWQASVTDEQIKKAILYGGAGVGKSPVMPASPDLDGKPELDALVAYVRELGG